jgi:signal transduction histidine kinase/ActR/RegA family two-component response regulator
LVSPPSIVIGALGRRPRGLVMAFTATVLVAVAAVEIADLWALRDRALQAADARARNLAYVLSEYVRDSFAVADSSLRQLAIHAQRVGGAQAPAAEWLPILTAAQAALAGRGSISVTDAAGRIVHSTQPRIIGQSRADTYIFKELARSGRDDLIVDRPFPIVVDPGRYTIPLGRRLTGRDGGFDGMVVATVLPDSYREFFKTVDVGHDGMTWVFHPDGIVLFREPSSGNPIGEPAAGNRLLRAALGSPGNGVVTGPLVPGGPRLVSAYRRLATPPVVVAVALDEREVLADWRHQRRVSAIGFAILTVTLGAMVLVLFAQMTSTARVERELGDLQRVESERLREANERLAGSLDREQRARRESDAASRLKDEFLMTVSHELRTPLTAIYGWVRMLAAEAVPVDQRGRALAAIERNALVQTRLIDELLDVSRATSGKLRIDARRLQAADPVRAAAETLAPALAAKSIRLETTLDPAAGAIVADPDRLQQIVWNLLSNAIKFTPDGGSIELRLARRGEHVEIAVADSGAGIAPEFLPHVFEAFRQGDAGTRRRYGGLGLGLAIVRHLVELHGGTVTAESGGEGRGATFTVTLPAAGTPAAAAPGAPDPPAREATAGARRLDGVRVLVVDDELESRELFASILAGAGAAVRTVPSAADARSVLAAGPVDVLLSDIEMPGEDGYELLQGVLDGRRAGRAPLVAVAVTAYARAVDRRRALEAGFHEHIAKPVDPATLVSTIASLVASGVGS